MKPSSSANDFHYKRKDELENLKIKLIQKLNRDIENKYKTILKNKNIKINFFEKELKKEIEKYFDFNNPYYSKLFQQVEKIVLAKLNKKEDLKRESLLNKKEIKNMLAEPMQIKHEHDLIREYPSHSQEQNNKISESQKFSRSHLSYSVPRNINLKSELNKKQKDEWAKLTKNDYQNFLIETKNKEIQIKQSQQFYKEQLEIQIKLKREIEKLRKSEEDKLLNEIIQITEESIKNEEDNNFKKIKDKKTVLRKIQEDNFTNQVLKSETIKKLKEEDNKIDQEMKNILIRENEKLEVNLKEKAIMEKKLNKYLKKQINSKIKEKKRNDSKNKLEDKNYIQKTKEELENENEQNIRIKKELMNKYKNDLDLQLMNKSEMPFMSDIEKSINKRLIDKCI